MDDLALLRLLTWLSPAFPTGAFSYSHGLEWAVASGDITDEPTLQAWLADLLEQGSPRSDLILLRQAHRGHDVLALARALPFGLERHLETTAQGNAFLRAAAPWPRPAVADPPVPYPVAVALVARASGVPEHETALATIHAVAANLVSAAVRLVPLGQSAGLRVLAALEPTLVALVHDTADATLDDVGSITLRADLASLHHETPPPRLFRT